MAWKSGDVQYDFLLPIYAPTGSYKVGRLGNTGLNYWTFDPIVGVSYNNAKSGFNAAAHLGYAINTENGDTQYKSGNVLHLDASVQQIFPLGSDWPTSAPKRGTSTRSPATAAPARRSAASRAGPPASARCSATSSRSASRE